MPDVLEVKEVKRVFMWDGEKLEDPNPSLAPDEVMGFYSMRYPGMTTATIGQPTVNKKGELEFEIEQTLGTKG